MQAQSLQQDRSVGKLEVVHLFGSGPIPTGVTVSQQGRIFLNFPHWGDKVEATVVELKGDRLIPYPAELPQSGSADPAHRLLSVQSVVVDQKNRLWLLDTGRIEGAPAPTGGAKLVGVDLSTDKVFRTILLPADVAPANSYMNDVRFDYTRGTDGIAYLTDSSEFSHGLMAVDLATGRSWKRLTHDPSTAADPSMQAVIEGEPVLVTGPEGRLLRPQDASDGIALSRDHRWIYYCPLFSRHLYRVEAGALANPSLNDETVVKTVEDLGEKGMSDGMESDAEGRVYYGDLENNSVRRRLPDGSVELLAHDPRILWADTFSLAHDGYLYFTANQLHRLPRFHGGRDERVYPYVLFRIKVDGTPTQ